ncbi:hypothetical protein ACA910_000872 [Epithemia clementina (nom. ined.)]
MTKPAYLLLLIHACLLVRVQPFTSPSLLRGRQQISFPITPGFRRSLIDRNIDQTRLYAGENDKERTKRNISKTSELSSRTKNDLNDLNETAKKKIDSDDVGDKTKTELDAVHEDKNVNGKSPSSKTLTDDEGGVERTSKKSLLKGENLVETSNLLLNAEQVAAAAVSGEAWSSPSGSRSLGRTTRRVFFSTAVFGAGFALGKASDNISKYFEDQANRQKQPVQYSPSSKLQWEVTPINKRTGVTVFDAEKAGYNVRFVTYLSRFLLSFDEDCQRWWLYKAKEIPKLAKEDEIASTRNQQFAAFAASVEVGLQEFKGEDGPSKLLRDLVQQYGFNAAAAAQQQQSAGGGTSSSSSSTSESPSLQELTAKEAQRQIALLFALMEVNQPVNEITKLLAAIDNGSLKNGVEIINPGGGYAPGYGPPLVSFPPPEAIGEGYEQATGRAILRPNGRLLRIDIVNRGKGYKNAPTVTIGPPAAIRFAEKDDEEPAEQATAKAVVFRSGPNKGRIDRIELINPGVGYKKTEIIKVRVSPPDVAAEGGGVTATATAILEYEVGAIEMTNNGTGYAVEKPIYVEVEPPPITARVNMNDPMLVSRILADGGTDLDPQRLQEIMGSKVMNAASKKMSGCLGRACYDTPVEAVAYASSERVDSYTSSFESGSGVPFVSGSGDYGTLDIPKFGYSQSNSASKQLLSLIPGGIGLVFDDELGRYVLAVQPDVEVGGFFFPQSKSYQTFDPDFGPRGRSPIERDMVLGFGTYLRFVAAGAICCSIVHLALTPIDVVKTRVQTDPENYPDMVTGVKRVLEEGGIGGFFRGWAPTFVGFFCWGGVAYAMTEYFRRTLQVFALQGLGLTGNLEVPIIIAASGVASIFGSFVISPFEAVRIRSVAQPDYAPDVLAVLDRMVREEGVWALFSAVPVFLLKEIPFAVAKFTVFDISTDFLYEQFPAAREVVQLSLLVSLAGGTIGGIAAGIVSNPADATISEMKKAQSSMGAVEAASLVLEKGGVAGLFRGLPIRLIFYSLMISMQFLVYDAVRLALGVGSDDLKLYLDVLGGVLRDVNN